MEAKEFLVDKTKILTKEYKLDQTNPGRAIQYVRNSNGTLMVDSNIPEIESQRLVINLINTRYKLLSFNNVLKTDFEEFLDPEIVVPDEQQNFMADQTGTILDLQNQVNNKDQIIDNLNKTIDNLSTTLSIASAVTASAAFNVAETINKALTEAANADNKKARIFSDGTLIRDRDRPAYFYIIEDGKKRFFKFNEELLNITAKSLGKIKTVNGQTVPDLIDVSQSVIDDIPSGAPFVNFDLVKNVQTAAPAPLDLGGQPLAAEWIYPADGTGRSANNPIVINVTTTNPSNADLVLDLQMQVATSQGIVNFIEVWDWPENSVWLDGNSGQNALPIKIGYSQNDNDYRRYINAGTVQSVENIKVILKNSRLAITPGSDNGLALANRYPLLPLSFQNREFNFVLTPKIENDVNNILHAVDKRLYVTVRYNVKMPDVIGKTSSAARNVLQQAGIPNSNIVVNQNQGVRTTNSSLYFKVSDSNPPKDSFIIPNSVITLDTYQPGDIILSNSVLNANIKFVNVIKALKSKGFINFIVTDIQRTVFQSDHTNITKISTGAIPSINLSSTGQTYTIPYNAFFNIKLDICNSAFSVKYNRRYFLIPNKQAIINEFNQLIPLI